MRKPTTLLAVLPALLLISLPAAAGHGPGSQSVKKKMLRLADQVADGARDVYRTASQGHGRHSRGGYGGYDRYGKHKKGYPSSRYRHRDPTLTALYDLEHRARAFERALHHRPGLHQTHHEYEALIRSFERSADLLHRGRPSYALVRDFDCLAEYMHSLASYYDEYAYTRRAWYRGPEYRNRNRVEVYGPRWNVDLEWPGRGWRYDDEDSDSY